MSDELIRFVDHALAKGMDHATIRLVLSSAGWKEKDIAEVFCTRSLELTIPEPPRAGPSPVRSVRQTGSAWPRRARDGLLHLLTYAALYTWATSVILLLFTYTDFAFPDPAWRTSYAALAAIMSSIRAQLAIVIVAFPVFLSLWHFLLREVRRDPEKAKNGIRRWLGYLALCVGAIALSGDAITLIYFLLEGELTVRLMLKAAVLFVIAGSLVSYLALTLRSEMKTEAVR